MQPSPPTTPVTSLDPSASLLSHALQLNSGSTPAHIVLSSGGDPTARDNRPDNKLNKASWIRRLTPRDEPELSKGGLADAVTETLNPEKGDSAERMDKGLRSVQTGCFPHSTAMNASRARPNWKAECVADVKRHKFSTQKDRGEGERQGIDFCQEKTLNNEPGKDIAATVSVLPSNVGFGPWINRSSGRKLDINAESVGVGSKNITGYVTSAQELSKDVQGSFHAPSLSPIRGKIGLPPRPPGFYPPSKTAFLASGMGRGVLFQLARDIQSDRQFSDTPFNREAVQVVGVQDKETSKFGEAAIDRSGLSFHKPELLEQGFPCSVREHGTCISDGGRQVFASSFTRMGNNDLSTKQSRPSVVERVPMEQQLGNCPDGAAVRFENGRRGGVAEDLHVKMFREGVKETICTNLPPDALDMNLHMKVSRPAMEDPKAASMNGSLLQTASLEPTKIALQQSPSGSSHGTLTSAKADASASSSASLPWEMFVEPAGASKKAREQFVEVYNRARDELKNQRMFPTTSRAPAREMDGGPSLTLGPGDSASDHRSERQSMKHEHHSAGHTQVLGRLKILSTNPERRTLSLASNLREQHGISLAESNGLVSISANEQSLLHRDTTEGFKRVQTLPEGQLRWNVKTVVQEGDKIAACQRPDERAVAHSKELRARDKDGLIFSSNSASNPKELVSKLDEDNKCNSSAQVTRVSHRLYVDRQESIPALGKRFRVNFEDHAISRVAEKGAVSRARPHLWLQRWHSTAMYNPKGLPDSHVPSDGKRDDSASYLPLGLKKFKDGDGFEAFGRVRDLRNVSADKEKGVNTLKMLPSAAAMAIVGTAARQFCSVQPQRKGSFAFWSGFGMPPPRKVEPVQEKVKGNRV